MLVVIWFSRIELKDSLPFSDRTKWQNFAKYSVVSWQTQRKLMAEFAFS